MDAYNSVVLAIVFILYVIAVVWWFESIE